MPARLRRVRARLRMTYLEAFAPHPSRRCRATLPPMGVGLSDCVFAYFPPHPLDPPPTEGVSNCVSAPTEGASDCVLAPTEGVSNFVLALSFSFLNSLFPIHNSQFFILHSPFSILHSPFSIFPMRTDPKHRMHNVSNAGRRAIIAANGRGKLQKRGA